MTTRPEDQDQMMPVAGQQRPPQQRQRRGGYQRQGIGEAVLKALIRSIAASLGRIIVRAIRSRMR
jgi:hypothetical protein